MAAKVLSAESMGEWPNIACWGPAGPPQNVRALQGPKHDFYGALRGPHICFFEMGLEVVLGPPGSFVLGLEQGSHPTPCCSSGKDRTTEA